MNNSPDSLPGCLGYFNRKQKKCQMCIYQKICTKVVPREECIKLLHEILDEIQETKKVLKF